MKESKVYYHVAPAAYKGGDILCRNSLDLKGIEYRDKWDYGNDYPDSDIVCLFDDIHDARNFRGEYEPGGVILRITFPDWAYREGIHLVTNNEGYTAVLGNVPEEFVSKEEIS